MRRNQTLSQRAQTSVIAPRSCVSFGSSQTAARGWRFGTKTKNENSAADQIARRDQRKISGAGFPARGSRISRRAVRFGKRTR